MSLYVEIVSPDRSLWSGLATALMARSSVGEFTVLDQHTAMVGDVVSGVVRVATIEGAEIAFCVHGGYFQVGPGEPGQTRATVLAGVAELTTEIDVARAEAAKSRAEAELAAATRADHHDGTLEALSRGALERAELRLRAASR